MSLGLFLNDLVDFAQGSITVNPWVSVDKNNQATYGAAVTYDCQVGGPVKFMHRESAQERVSSQTLYVFTADQLSSKDKITMQAGFDGSLTPKIAQIDRQSDEQGFCYTVIYLG
jgi:hypothetical protein